jgi:hypothetical protein
MEVITGVEDPKSPLSQLEGSCDCLSKSRITGAGPRKVEDKNINVVLLEAFQALEFLNFLPLIVHQKASISLSSGPVGNIAVKSFSAAHNRGEDVKGPSFQMGPDRLNNGILSLGNDGLPGLGAMLSAQFRIK